LARETADSYCLGSHRSRDLWISGSLLPKYFSTDDRQNPYGYWLFLF
jgi:hypothetical protein